MSNELPFIKADQGRLAQVMNNLISNALCYVPVGGEVIIGGKESGTEIVFWVSDNGPGIPAEALPHVFERFFRADPSRSRESGGSGLGLAIARRLVMLHNGRIWVESQPGQLTSIYVALPKYKPNSIQYLLFLFFGLVAHGLRHSGDRRRNQGQL